MQMTHLFAILACVIHIIIFFLESLLFTKPIGRKVFRMTETTAQINRLFAFNQGFYNLFLALGILYGLFIGEEGQVLVDFIMFSIFSAALVLFMSEPKLVRGALLQGAPAFLYFVFRFLLIP